MSVTDKELLTFCNLTNLKMEYANLIKGYEDGPKDSNGKTTKIPINHTIYSLLDAEVKSFKSEVKRILLDLKITKMHLGLANTNLKKDQLKQIKKRLEDEYDKLDIDKVEGVFYSQEESKEIEYLYLDEEDLCRNMGNGSLGAPYLVERYIKFRDCDDKTNHQFIDEWVVLDYLDNYIFAKRMYDKLKQKQNTAKEIAKEINNSLNKKENLSNKEHLLKTFLKTVENPKIENFPTRKEVIKNKEFKLILTGLRVVGKIGIESFGGKISSKILKKLNLFDCLGESAILNVLSLDDEAINALASPKNFKELLSYNGKIAGRFLADGIASINEANPESIEKKILEKALNESTKTEFLTTDYDMSLAGFKQTIDLTTTGIGCLLLKKKDEDCYVIALKNNEDLYILDNNLNIGEIPKEIFQLLELVEELKDKHSISNEAQIYITGIGNAAKLASMYKVFDSTVECKGYFSEDPLNIGTIVDLTPRDISLITKNKYTTTLEIISQSLVGEDIEEFLPTLVEGLTLVIGGILAVSFFTPASVIAFSIFLISNLKNIYERFESQKDFEETIEFIFKDLQNNEIIDKIYIEKEGIAKPYNTQKTIKYKRYEYPNYKSEMILGKVLNLEKELKVKFTLDLNDIKNKIRDYTMFNSIEKYIGKDIKLEKEIIFKSLKNYVNIIILIKANNYFILELTEKEIIFGNKKLENIVIYQIENEKFIKLKYKTYKYYKIESISKYNYSKNEKKEYEVRFLPPTYMPNNISYPSTILDTNPLKPVDENNSAPKQHGLAMLNEIFEYIKNRSTKGKYYELTETKTLEVFGNEFFNLLENFKNIQIKYNKCIEKEENFGISYSKDTDGEEYLKKLKYTLEKMEIKKFNRNILKDNKICRTKIIPCVDEITGYIPL